MQHYINIMRNKNKKSAEKKSGLSKILCCLAPNNKLGTPQLEKEKEDGAYEKVPFHYMEIAMLLLDR